MNEHTQRKLPVLPIAIGIGALALFVVAFLLGRSGPAAQVTDLNAELASTRTQVDQARLERDQLAARLHVRDAQASIVEAVSELERRNFGRAETLLNATADSLEQVDAELAGVDAVNLTTLIERIRATNVAVTPDLGVQRFTLQDLASDVGKLLPTGE